MESRKNNTEAKKNVIFISYRKEDGLEYASLLKAELDNRGYSVFMDDEDLGNGPFYGGVFNVIDNSAIFLALLTQGYFGMTSGPDDWVIAGLHRALISSRPIFLLNPNHLFGGFPKSLPSSFKELLSIPIQDITFGKTLPHSVNILDVQLRHYTMRKNAKRTFPIFVSYTRADKDIVFPFVERIEKELNVNCWIDLEGIESGEQFEDVIIHAIDSSRIVLFMLSDNALQSSWTKREVYYAEGEGKRIVPVVIDGKGLRGWFKFHFGNVDFIDITASDNYLKLISNLHSWLGSTLLRRGVADGHEWVDMGTNVKWALTNIGASKPEETGDLFAWGEIQSKSEYSWGTYRFGETKNCLTKYIPAGKQEYGKGGITDAKMSLEKEDDTAAATWGDFWRLPTKDDVKNLLDVCDRAWTKRNGRSGFLLTSRISGEQLFLPAAGSMNGSLHEDLGSIGRYWASSVDTTDPCFAWSLLFNTDNIYSIFTPRCSGLAIRPVCD